MRVCGNDLVCCIIATTLPAWSAVMVHVLFSPPYSGTVYACATTENPAGSNRVHLSDGEWNNSNHKVRL